MKRQKIRNALLLVFLLLFPVTLYYLSPYLIIQGGFSGIVTGSFLAFAALFLSSLFFGRAFCGWVCPAGALQECCMKVNDKKVNNKKTNWIKYIIWVPWLISIVLAFINAGGMKSVDFLYMTDHGISMSGIPGTVMYYFVVALILVLALTVGRRGMCHTVCWMAPFMILGTKFGKLLKIPSLRLKANPEQCTGCGVCAKNCPMSLDTVQMVRENKTAHSECILCGKCADGCAKKAVELTFKRQG